MAGAGPASHVGPDVFRTPPDAELHDARRAGHRCDAGRPKRGLLLSSTQSVKFALLNRLNTSSIGSTEYPWPNERRFVSRRSTRCRSFLLKLLSGMIEPSARVWSAMTPPTSLISTPDSVVLHPFIAVEVETAQHDLTRKLIDGVEHRPVLLVPRPVPLRVVVVIDAAGREVARRVTVRLRETCIPVTGAAQPPRICGKAAISGRITG
jgi:hypothetical protein